MCTKPSDDAKDRDTITNEGENAHGNPNEESNGTLSPPIPSANNPEMSTATCSNQLNYRYMQTSNVDMNTTNMSQDNSHTDDIQHRLEGRSTDGLHTHLSPPSNPHKNNHNTVLHFNARCLIHKILIDELGANCLLYKPEYVLSKHGLTKTLLILK